MDNQSNTNPETVQDAVQPTGEQASPSPVSEETATPQVQQPTSFKEEVGSTEPKGQTGEKQYTPEQNNSYYAGKRKGLQEAQEQLRDMVKPMVEQTIQDTLARTPQPQVDNELRQKVANMEYVTLRQNAVEKHVAENPDDAAFKAQIMQLGMDNAYKDLTTADLVLLAKAKAGGGVQPQQPAPATPAPQNAPALGNPNQAQMNAPNEQEKQALIDHMKHSSNQTISSMSATDA